MSYTVSVENIKCGGCANTIRTKLELVEGVETISIDIESGCVTIDGNETHRETVIVILLKLGYPETGTTEGIASVKAKAKSFVSCAAGRLSS